MARIPPLPEDEWDDDVRPILEASGRAIEGRLGDNNIFSTLARHKDLLRPWCASAASCSAAVRCLRASASC